MTTLPWVQNFVHSLWPHGQDPNAADHETIRRIRVETARCRNLADHQLVARAEELRQEELPAEDQLVGAFALVNEAAQRTLQIDYYDVQLLAGLALARGCIAEMHTGEGKTFVAALPAFLFALAGRGVHVMTVNGYLAERDCELLTPLYALLGMSTGFLKPQASAEDKRCAYACDITYGPGYEFGFDYLRDQASAMSADRGRAGDTFRSLLNGRDLSETLPTQRGHASAIIDEIDSVLIDEASSPLILSAGPPADPCDVRVYREVRQVAQQLVADVDFVVESANHMIRLTLTGTKQATAALTSLVDLDMQRPWTHYVEQALRAQEALSRDVDYIVDDDAIVLVDQSTGRIFRDRSLRDGLHQAVEAKEGVTITAERQPLARIPRQRYVRLYDVVCGMTGTAGGSERELWEFYRLGVVRIPLRKESRRVMYPPRFFADQEAKWRAIGDDVQRIHETRQPLLVGTPTIECSQTLACRLDDLGVGHQLLNGVQDADEAAVIAQAGVAGAVTIATNMAGRGTDIKLADGVASLGGLHVIASEPNESARIDRQLMGRCARQGDPGTCQLYVSADDRLLTDHAPGLVGRLRSAGGDAGEIEQDLAREILRAQRKAERSAYARRRRLFAHDAWLEGVLAALAKEG